MPDLRPVVCYLSAAAADWGGASRVLFTNLKLLDKSRFRPLVLLPKQGPIIDSLVRWGVEYRIWGPEHEPRNPLAYGWQIVRSMAFFAWSHTRILHINHTYWRPAEIVAARLLGIPIFSHFHWVPATVSPAVKYSTALIAVSQYVANALPDYGVPKYVVHNCLDPERFAGGKDIRSPLGIEPNRLVISFIGQVKRIKGIDLFIDLAEALDDPRLTFLIAGRCLPADKSELDDRLRKTTRDIRYLGYREDVEDIYHSSDIIVVPSRWQEPFGLVILEAGIAGKPVVATNVGGIPEIIRDCDNGMLVSPDDPLVLVASVAALCGNADLRKELGRRARDTVLQKFSGAPVRELERVYDCALR